MGERRLRRLPRVCGWVLGPIGLLVPARLRREWRREWAAELWHEVARLEAAGASLAGPLARRLSGVLADALAVRWCYPGPAAEDFRSAAAVIARSPGAVGAALGFLALAIAGATVVVDVLRFVRLMPRELQGPDLAVSCAVAVLLLVAGVFAAATVVAQCEAGRREEAMRRAMGVEARRLKRQRRFEAMLVAVVGSAAGVWLALAGTARLGEALAMRGAAAAAAGVGERGLVLGAGVALSLLVAGLMALAPGVVGRQRGSP
ncbi:MAG TPA: FtsX-like permease family protein [Longimicrobiales bacterium]|nr:FtsX-like permease family protein [Longimicrobiales bacterium]